MNYSIKELAKLAGVSTRTLRYYDQIGLLSPAEITPAGYRKYSTREVDTLQQILMLKALDLDLAHIKRLIDSSGNDQQEILAEHLVLLKKKKTQMDMIIETIEKTIASMKGDMKMTDGEKFEGFKQELIDANDEKYGDEVEARWGADVYKESQAKVKRMSKEQWAEVENLSNQINENLKQAFDEGDPGSATARKACDLHRQWLCHFWPDDMYTVEGHRLMGQMYCDDPRLRAHYDEIASGCAEFFRDALNEYEG